MKISLITPLIASAVLVSAVPLRVLVVPAGDSHAVSGHAEHASGDDSNVATFVQPAVELESKLPDVKWFAAPQLNQDNEGQGESKRPHHAHHSGRPCGMSKGAKGKLIEIGNTFRGAFGMPLIEMGEFKEGHIHGGMIKITKFTGEVSPPPHHMKHHAHHHHMHHNHHHGKAFSQRITDALMSLGPWEGRAVAFVLGCGIGVLLRIVFLMALLSYRAIKGVAHKEEEDESEVQYAVIYEYQDDAEEIAVPPPNYNFPVDEKIAPAAEESK